MHPKVTIIEAAMHNVLKPLGFRKQKLVWRRKQTQLVQVVGLEKMTSGWNYNLRFGLSINALTDNPRLPLHRLHVHWTLPEKLGKRIRNHRDRISLLAAINPDSGVQDDVREACIGRLLSEFVLPAFDATDTLETLRSVLMNTDHPWTTGYRREVMDLLNFRPHWLADDEGEPVSPPRVVFRVKPVKCRRGADEGTV